MTQRLNGKVAVITGAASGIGAATAQRFVAEGARVVATDIQDDAGRAVTDELGDAAIYVHADVTRDEDIEAAVAAAIDNHGRLDVMVNNAGLAGGDGRITETPTDAWDHTVAVLMRSVFLGTNTPLARWSRSAQA